MGRLHPPRPTAGDDREAGCGQLVGDIASELVHRRAGRGASGAEDRDRRPYCGKGVEVLDERRQYPKRPPSVTVAEVRSRRLRSRDDVIARGPCLATPTL